MCLYYIDDSGHPEYKKNSEKQYTEPLFVIGGIIIDEVLWFKIDEKINEFKKNKFPNFPKNFELHAYELVHGTGNFKDISEQNRMNLFKDFFKEIDDFNFFVIATSISKKGLVESGRDWPPLIVGYESIIRHFDDFCQKRMVQGIKIVDDRGSLNDRIVEIDKRVVSEGIDLPYKRKIKNLILDPVFVKSCDSNLMQFADMVVFVIFRHEIDLLYKKGRSKFFTEIFEHYLQKRQSSIYRYPSY